MSFRSLLLIQMIYTILVYTSSQKFVLITTRKNSYFTRLFQRGKYKLLEYHICILLIGLFFFSHQKNAFLGVIFIFNLLFKKILSSLNFIFVVFFSFFIKPIVMVEIIIFFNKSIIIFNSYQILQIVLITKMQNFLF